MKSWLWIELQKDLTSCFDLLLRFPCPLQRVELKVVYNQTYILNTLINAYEETRLEVIPSQFFFKHELCLWFHLPLPQICIQIAFNNKPCLNIAYCINLTSTRKRRQSRAKYVWRKIRPATGGWRNWSRLTSTSTSINKWFHSCHECKCKRDVQSTDDLVDAIASE